MDNVIELAGRRWKPVTFTVDSLADAFAVAAILAQNWWDEIRMVRSGAMQIVDANHVPLANPFPEEPKVRFAGQDLTVSAIVAMAGALVNEPLPAPLRVQMALWNCDDPDNPVNTYADAMEFVEGTILNAEDEQVDDLPMWTPGGAA